MWQHRSFSKIDAHSTSLYRPPVPRPDVGRAVVAGGRGYLATEALKLAGRREPRGFDWPAWLRSRAPIYSQSRAPVPGATCHAARSSQMISWQRNHHKPRKMATTLSTDTPSTRWPSMVTTTKKLGLAQPRRAREQSPVRDAMQKHSASHESSQRPQGNPTFCADTLDPSPRRKCIGRRSDHPVLHVCRMAPPRSGSTAKTLVSKTTPLSRVFEGNKPVELIQLRSQRRP